jgi:hypothetical protein
VGEDLKSKCFLHRLQIEPHFSISPIYKSRWARSQWLTSVILSTQEAEIRRILVESQPRQIVPKILSQKNPSQKRAGRVAQVCVGPEFKLQYHKKKK